jgi:signal peptidase
MSLEKETYWLLAEKKAKLPPQHLGSGENYFCAHIGTSMNPTLSRQDLLEIAPYQRQSSPKIGDVILFQVPHHELYAIHRIIDIKPDGFHTKGDNSDIIDPWVLQKEDICGQAVTAHQGDTYRKISGGFLGRLTGMSCVVRRKTNGLAVKLLGPVYRSFCTGGILNWLNPVRLTPRVATFQSDANESHKLLLGKRIIGSYDESLLQWQIKRPYRLFVDEASLPTPR